MMKNDIEKNNIKKDIIILISLFLLSFISIFGIYNTFTINLIDILNSIPNSGERYANYLILGLFVLTMGVLQGINLKKKDLFGKLSVIVGIIVMIAVILTIILFYTKSLMYPILTMVIIGITMYLLELVFVTIGTKGFFFFLTLFGLGIVWLYKSGVKEYTILVTVTELAIVLLLFIAATYPRIKNLMFHIGTRDNIDISNSDGEGEV